MNKEDNKNKDNGLVGGIILIADEVTDLED